MRYLTILDNQGGFFSETSEEAWEMVIGGMGARARYQKRKIYPN
jgi:hypothetical protein